MWKKQENYFPFIPLISFCHFIVNGLPSQKLPIMCSFGPAISDCSLYEPETEVKISKPTWGRAGWKKHN